MSGSSQQPQLICLKGMNEKQLRVLARDKVPVVIKDGGVAKCDRLGENGESMHIALQPNNFTTRPLEALSCEDHFLEC